VSNPRNHAATYGYESNLLRDAGDDVASIGEVYIDGQLVDRLRPATQRHITSDLFFDNQVKHFAAEFGVAPESVEILLTGDIHPHSAKASCLDCVQN
jgi:hypothetical protein